MVGLHPAMWRHSLVWFCKKNKKGAKSLVQTCLHQPAITGRARREHLQPSPTAFARSVWTMNCTAISRNLAKPFFETAIERRLQIFQSRAESASPCDPRESRLLDYNGTANTELLSPAQTRGVIVLENAFVIPSACDVCRMYVFLKKSEPSWRWNSIIPQPVICFHGEVTFNAFILILSLITQTCHRVGKECLQRLFSMIYYFLMQSNCSETVWIMHCAWRAAPQSFHFDNGKKKERQRTTSTEMWCFLI